MKRIHILVLVLLSLLLAGCKGHSYKDITVTSARIISIVPEGLSDLSALIEVGIHNPTVAFEVTGLEGLAKYQGQDAVTGPTRSTASPSGAISQRVSTPSSSSSWSATRAPTTT